MTMSPDAGGIFATLIGLVRRGLGGTAGDALEFTRLMARITLARNPSYALPPLGFVGTPTGIDARRVVDSGIAPVINTGIAHKERFAGQWVPSAYVHVTAAYKIYEPPAGGRSLNRIHICL